MSDINQLFSSSMLQRYYNADGDPCYITLSEILDSLPEGVKPTRVLAADDRLRDDTREAVIKYLKGHHADFDHWLVEKLENPRHTLKILLDRNFPGKLDPFIEDRLGSIVVAPAGISKRGTKNWGAQADYDLVVMRHIGPANRPTPQFAKAAQAEDEACGAPIAVLCSQTSSVSELEELLGTLDKLISEGHLTSDVAELRINRTGCMIFRRHDRDPEVMMFAQNHAAAQPNHASFDRAS